MTKHDETNQSSAIMEYRIIQNQYYDRYKNVISQANFVKLFSFLYDLSELKSFVIFHLTKLTSYKI